MNQIIIIIILSNLKRIITRRPTVSLTAVMPLRPRRRSTMSNTVPDPLMRFGNMMMMVIIIVIIIMIIFVGCQIDSGA